jgi:acetylornithine deacetylase
MVEFDDGLSQTIRGAVHARREDAVSLLRELVRVPSVTGAEGAVGAVVGSTFSERGLDVDTWEATREETEPYRDHVGEQISYENRPNAPICGAVKKAHERVTGETPAVEGVAYAADMRIFIHFGGMPCVMYGAGDVNVAHAPDEHISITELLTAATTVACLLADWCGVAD